MKTLSPFSVIIILFANSIGSVFGEKNLPNEKTKIPKHSILTLIKGMDSENMGLKISCILTAGEYRIEESVETLINLLSNSDEPDKVKQAVVFALYNIRTSNAISALKYASENNKSLSVKVVAYIFFNDFFRNSSFNPANKNYVVVE